jgi:putative endonuclease
LTTRSIGRAGEETALRHLRRKRYRILETGFRFYRGEIDIIARDRETLVFIEVKMRRGCGFGRPEESVTPAKQQQIRKVAEGYLLKRRISGRPCRFDVIAIRPDSRSGYVLEHFRNAF